MGGFWLSLGVRHARLFFSGILNIGMAFFVFCDERINYHGNGYSI